MNYQDVHYYILEYCALLMYRMLFMYIDHKLLLHMFNIPIIFENIVYELIGQDSMHGLHMITKMFIIIF